jgi:hypothetical protein
LIPKELILEAKNKLGIEAARTIAHDLDIEMWDDRLLKGKSPFKSENTPSFIWCDKENYFKCFATGKVYDIINHYIEYNKLTYIKAIQKLFAEVGIIYDFNEFTDKRNFQNYKYPIEEKNKDRQKVEDYVFKRGISKETLDYADIKQDLKGNIVFEHRDINGELLCVKYRPARKVKKEKGEMKTWWQKDASTCPILYGIDKIDITKPLLITEGHIDRLACIEAGYYNVVSIPHGANDISFLEFNWEFLDNFEIIILYGDNDVAGNKFLKETTVRIGEHKIKHVIPDIEIKNKIREYYQRFVKNSNITKADANNVLLACGKEELLKIILNAKEVPVPDIIQLMNCEEFDLRNANVITTGLNIIDNKIYGNVEGTLTLYSGTTGSGKSLYTTLTCINEPINQGMPVFLYSGELPNPQVKNWVIRQLAGRNHIIQWDNGQNKPITYSVTNEAKRKIEEKYMGLLYAYDAFLIVTPKQLLNKMEYMVKKYGVKDFLIDNMMCVDIEDENELRAQKNFTMELLIFAKKYMARINLVIHPKKLQFGNEVGIYDLYGSSSTSNLAHRIFTVRRVTQKEKMGGDKKEPVLHDTYVKCLKDRILGTPEIQWGLYYDPSSQRLYSDYDSVDKKYSWDGGEIRYNNPMFGKNGKLVNYQYDEWESEVFGRVQK